MHSTVELVAERDPRRRRTVLRRARAGGHFAVRETGDGTVHLVGTAAGPLGGDTVRVRIEVGPGAGLSVRAAAATIVLPGRLQAGSDLRITATVAEGGSLDLALEPTVVCAGAEHTAGTEVRLAAGADLRLVEEVVLGRSGERAGGWTGRTAVLRDGVPLLRQVVHAADLTPSGVRALAGTVLAPAGSTGDDRPRVHGCAVVMPLAAGGLLGTAVGPDLLTARGDLARVLASRSTVTLGG